MEGRADGKDPGDEGDDQRVVGEELWEVVPEGGEEDDVKNSYDCGYDEGLGSWLACLCDRRGEKGGTYNFGACSRGVGEGCADEICYSG